MLNIWLKVERKDKINDFKISEPADLGCVDCLFRVQNLKTKKQLMGRQFI